MAQAVYERITNRILTLLEEGTVPWQRPWSSETGMPRNLVTERAYHGINVWLLGSLGYTQPFWATFKQVQQAGGHVKRGEHGTPIIFWSAYQRIDKATGEAEKAWVLKSYTVFNASQCDDITVPELNIEPYPFTPIEQCEKLVGQYPLAPMITHGREGAYYRPAADTVYMPDPQAFPQREEYYSTLFHELTHSTGHASRLNRPTLKDALKFGDTNYSKEELVAEMGASFLCGVCGIENVTVQNSAAYLQGWMKALRGDARLLIQAAAQAEKAAEYMQGLQAGTNDTAV